MLKKGFVLVTSLIVISSVAVLVLMQATYLQALERKLTGYYKIIQQYNNTKSERAYQDWVSRQ